VIQKRIALVFKPN